MDKLFMEKAYEQAEKSVCLRAKVGAVIVRNGLGVKMLKMVKSAGTAFLYLTCLFHFPAPCRT